MPLESLAMSSPLPWVLAGFFAPFALGLMFHFLCKSRGWIKEEENEIGSIWLSMLLASVVSFFGLLAGLGLHGDHERSVQTAQLEDYYGVTISNDRAINRAVGDGEAQEALTVVDDGKPRKVYALLDGSTDRVVLIYKDGPELPRRQN